MSLEVWILLRFLHLRNVVLVWSSHFPAIILYVEGVIFGGQLVVLAIDLSPGVLEVSLPTYVTWSSVFPSVQ